MHLVRVNQEIEVKQDGATASSDNPQQNQLPPGWLPHTFIPASCGCETALRSTLPILVEPAEDSQDAVGSSRAELCLIYSSVLNPTSWLKTAHTLDAQKMLVEGTESNPEIELTSCLTSSSG